MSAETKRITMREPKDGTERMFAALSSTIDDLYPNGNGRVIVTGKNIDGEVLYLGDICESLLFLKGVNPMAVIERVRFGGLS